MFGVDHTMRGQEAVLDVRQHGVRPAEGRVARCGAIGAGDVSLMENARLLGNAAKPLAAIADDGGSGGDTRAQPLGFPGLAPAHDLEAGGAGAGPPAHGLLVSPVWNPRTTWRRACSGRPSAEVSTAMMKGVWPRRPRPAPSPVRSPPIKASSLSI